MVRGGIVWLLKKQEMKTCDDIYCVLKSLEGENSFISHSEVQSGISFLSVHLLTSTVIGFVLFCHKKKPTHCTLMLIFKADLKSSTHRQTINIKHGHAKNTNQTKQTPEHLK